MTKFQLLSWFQHVCSERNKLFSDHTSQITSQGIPRAFSGLHQSSSRILIVPLKTVQIEFAAACDLPENSLCSSFICSVFSLPRLFYLILRRNHFQFHQLSECSVKTLFLPFERTQGTTSPGRICFGAQPDPGDLSNSQQDVPGTQVTNGCSLSSRGNVSAPKAILSSCQRHSAVNFSLNNHHRHNYG